MKINVERKALERALETGGQMAGRNRSQAILDHIKVTLKKGRMRVTSFSGAVGVSAPLDTLSGGEDGDAVFCTEPKRLLQAVKLMDGEVVSLLLDDSLASMTVEHDSGHITVPLVKADDFPDFGRERTETEVHMNGEALAEWARISEKFAAHDELRPVLAGMLLYGSGNEIGFCASDSHILVTDSMTCEDGRDFSIIVPALAFGPIQKCFKTADSVRMLMSGQGVVFSCGSVSLYSRLVSGKYPNFRAIIPEQAQDAVSVEKDTIISAVRRLMISANSSMHLMVMEFGGDSIAMRSEDAASGCSTSESLPCSCPDKVEVGLNGELFAVALESVKGDQVHIGIVGPKNPVLMTGDASSRRRTVIMPLAY